MTPAPVADAPVRSYFDFFDPAAKGQFSRVLPIAIFFAIFVSNQTYLLLGLGSQNGSNLFQNWKASFPYFQLGDAGYAAASACVLAWLSYRVRTMWQLGLAYGALDGLFSGLGVVIGNLSTSGYRTVLVPPGSWQDCLSNLFWGLCLMLCLGVAIRIGGLRLPALVIGGIAGWFVFGGASALLYFHSPWSWLRWTRFALNGALWGLGLYIGLRAQRGRSGFAPVPDGETASPEHPDRVRKGLYVTAVSVGAACACLLLAAAERRGSGFGVSGTLVAAWIVAVVTSIPMFMLVHKMWTAIQDGQARMTAEAAVGRLFIPLFNFYWLFPVFWGFAKDYNAFRERHGTGGPLLKTGLFLALPILILASQVPVIWFPISLVRVCVLVMVTAQICDAINRIGHEGSASGEVPALAAAAGLGPGESGATPPASQLL
jgi:hypothetical protein